MARKRNGLVPIGEAFGGLDGPVKAIRDASPQARHHFTQADQVNQLVGASEADPYWGFMARMLVLCSLPRTNPGTRLQYKRVNGPFTLYMTVSGGNKLPFGNLPRLLIAWLCTEAVRTQNPEIVLGPSLSAPPSIVPKRRFLGRPKPVASPWFLSLLLKGPGGSPPWQEFL